MLISLLADTGNKIVPTGLRWPLLVGVISLAISWILTPLVRKFAIDKGAVDDPNRDDRRIHKAPLPRWGGLAIYAGLTLSVLLVMPFANPAHPYPVWLIGILSVGFLLVLAGALDDLYQYAARVQLMILLVAGVAIQNFHSSDVQVQIKTIGVPFTTGYITLGLWAIPITAVYIFVVTKTMDTIDGVDGLAAGIATIGAGTLTLISVYNGRPQVALMSAAVGGAALGFLRHNYNPAKIIMGTGGAYILGFSLACLSIVGALKTAAAFALVVPLLVFGVPIIDAVQVIIRRLSHGVPITQADKRHIHHQLLAKGLTQRQTVWVLYGLAVVLATVAILMIRYRVGR